jgi:VWFA-related protein
LDKELLTMRKSSAWLLLLSLLTVATAIASAQTRARRVGQGGPAAVPSPSAPSRPPVLKGSNAGENGQRTTPSASAGPEEVDAGDVIRVNTTLVTIPVSVMDRDGKYIPNLSKNDFRLWEDGVEQDVAFFASVEKPFSVALVLDTSGSTRFRLEDMQDAAITFVNQLRPDDRVMVVSFDDQVRVLTDFTSDRYRLRDAIRRTRTGDGTKLYDAIDLVMNQKLNLISGRKAIVLFTDGVDTTSRHASYASNVRDAEELDALIYPVQYDTYADVGSGAPTWPGSRQDDILIRVLGGILGGGRGGRGIGSGGRGGVGSSRHDYEIANRYLHDLAEKTGARQYQADSTQNLAYAFSNIAEELRRQYSLGYYPKTPAEPGQRRGIRVRVNQPNLAVRTRDSYIFKPSGNADTHDTATQKSAPVLRKKLAERSDSTEKLINP